MVVAAKKNYTSELEEDIDHANSITQIRAQSSILGPVNKLLVANRGEIPIRVRINVITTMNLIIY